MLLNEQVKFKNWHMLILSQYHIFESYKINIYRVAVWQGMKAISPTAKKGSSSFLYLILCLLHSDLQPLASLALTWLTMKILSWLSMAACSFPSRISSSLCLKELKGKTTSVPISTVMCLWAIYIFLGSVHIFPAAEKAGNIKIAHRHMNVEIGLWPRNFFSVNICFKFSILVLCNVSPSTPNWCSIYTFFQKIFCF